MQAIVRIRNSSLGARAADRLSVVRVAAASAFEQSLQQIPGSAFPLSIAAAVLRELFLHEDEQRFVDDRGHGDRDPFGFRHVVRRMGTVLCWGLRTLDATHPS